MIWLRAKQAEGKRVVSIPFRRLPAVTFFFPEFISVSSPRFHGIYVRSRWYDVPRVQERHQTIQVQTSALQTVQEIINASQLCHQCEKHFLLVNVQREWRVEKRKNHFSGRTAASSSQKWRQGKELKSFTFHSDRDIFELLVNRNWAWNVSNGYCLYICHELNQKDLLAFLFFNSRPVVKIPLIS